MGINLKEQSFAYVHHCHFRSDLCVFSMRRDRDGLFVLSLKHRTGQNVSNSSAAALSSATNRAWEKKDAESGLVALCRHGGTPVLSRPLKTLKVSEYTCQGTREEKGGRQGQSPLCR